MIPIVAVVYLVLCLMVGFFGSRTQLGFFRSVFFSIMVTPFVVMIYLLLFSKLDAEREREKELALARRRGGVANTGSSPPNSTSAD